MGIPQCGGLHAVATEYLCMDCKYLGLRRAEVAASEERNNLMGEQLELEYRGLRRPRREAPPPPPPAPAPRTVYGQRGGMAIEPR
jgi:hypothetical protein